ncbi:MAG: hypothetical protein CVU03_02770 [Bacteroidetes bacterium HGW-Bacteroidetes-2]|jgi:hypothetical protein|nr:MAG: hypothetical protein CVU03_02770 [Bacteroidetes bacterium HGW-Bacteroidetes-2]
MIKFFRNIRKKLLEQGKTANYLKYAIGEIVLVVIGILIALSINNWNEQKKNEAKIVNTLKEIQNDIQLDLIQANRMFDYHLFTDSISKGVYNNTFTADDYRTGNLMRIGYNYRDFKIATNGFDNLKGNIDNIPEIYRPLLPEIKNLYVGLKIEIDVYNDRIRNTTYKNIDEDSRFDWSQIGLKGLLADAQIDYYLNDKKYKDLVANYMNDRLNIFKKANEYRIAAIDLYHKIHDAIGSKDTIPEIVNYNYKSTTSINEYVGTYTRQESVNTFWPKNIKVKEIEGKLQIQVDGKSTVNLFYYTETTFFSEDYQSYLVFNRPGKGKLYISPGANVYAIYEKTDSK